MNEWDVFKGNIDSMYGNSPFLSIPMSLNSESQIEDIFGIYIHYFFKPILSISDDERNRTPELYTKLAKDLTRWLTYRANCHSGMLLAEGNNDPLNLYMPVNQIFREVWQILELNTITRILYSVRNYNRDRNCTNIFENLCLSVSSDTLRHTSQIVIRPFTDDIWQVFYPPNRFNCQDVIRLSDEESSTSEFHEIPVNMALAHNPASTGRFFTENHPFYSVDESNKLSLDLLSQKLYDKYVNRLTPTPAKPYVVGIPNMIKSDQPSQPKNSLWASFTELFK
jgi:hypothetical protein